jgi:hypothetical protein
MGIIPHLHSETVDSNVHQFLDNITSNVSKEFEQIKSTDLTGKLIHQSKTVYQKEIKIVYNTDFNIADSTMIFETTGFDKNNRQIYQFKNALSPLGVRNWNYALQEWELIHAEQEKFIYLNAYNLLKDVSIFEAFPEKNRYQQQASSNIEKPNQDPEILASALDVLSNTNPQQIIKDKEFNFSLSEVKRVGKVDQLGLIISYQKYQGDKLLEDIQNQYIPKMETIDFQHIPKRIRINTGDGNVSVDSDRLYAPPPGSENTKSFGMVPLKKGNEVIVMAVFKGLPAARAGIKAGYKIKEVNGVNLSDLDQDALLEFLRKQETISLKCLDIQGQEISIKLVRDFPQN